MSIRAQIQILKGIEWPVQRTTGLGVFLSSYLGFVTQWYSTWLICMRQSGFNSWHHLVLQPIPRSTLEWSLNTAGQSKTNKSNLYSWPPFLCRSPYCQSPCEGWVADIYIYILVPVLRPSYAQSHHSQIKEPKAMKNGQSTKFNDKYSLWGEGPCDSQQIAASPGACSLSLSVIEVHFDLRREVPVFLLE